MEIGDSFALIRKCLIGSYPLCVRTEPSQYDRGLGSPKKHLAAAFMVFATSPPVAAKSL